ncbi:hypothetical protein CgunFtcFv8_024327 [Champsocephalus gunnari]|uniref:Uncharacterized protein n=1 Tax=Champsocephalus gunnari TaxID=52237 RepID=A0AAN8HLR1_CHAGU|nr:hypothetical protein CgunFtcFv8_024327 [Champsocephalus gunnari]
MLQGFHSLHKNTQKEYIFDHTCREGTLFCAESFQLVDQQAEDGREREEEDRREREEEDGWEREEEEGWEREEDDGREREEEEGWEREEDDGWEREEDDGWEREEDDGWEREEDDGWEREEEDGRHVGGKMEELPDGDVGTLSESASGTLQSGVDLSHLDRPLQTDHLQQLVTEVCREVCFHKS